MTKEKIMGLVVLSGMVLASGGTVLANDTSEPLVAETTILALASDPIDNGGGEDNPIPPVPSEPVSPSPETPPTPEVPPIEGTDPTNPADPKPSEPVIPSPEPEKPVEPKPEIPKEPESPVIPTPKPTPETKPITKPVVETPLVTDTGDRVIGTQDGKVIVQTDTGTELREASEVGGNVQEDGTVALKKSDGGLEVLPHTGDSKGLAIFFGVLLIAGALWVGFKETIKKCLTVFNKKEK